MANRRQSRSFENANRVTRNGATFSSQPPADRPESHSSAPWPCPTAWPDTRGSACAPLQMRAEDVELPSALPSLRKLVRRIFEVDLADRGPSVPRGLHRMRGLPWMLYRKPTVSCAASGAGLRKLRVEVDDPNAPLQLGVDESYSISVTRRGAVIRAATRVGAIWGLQTFRQLPEWDGTRFVVRNLPLSFRDAPTYPWRGLMLDTSRRFIPVEDILRTIEGMSLVKLNVFHWHLTDAQSFPFASRRFPHLAEHGAFHPSLVYTPDDVRAVVAHAADLGVRVVPELDAPAHAASWGFGQPELVARCPNAVDGRRDAMVVADMRINSVLLDPRNPKTVETYGGLLDELAGLFPDGVFHLGCDEVSKACMAEAGLRASHFERLNRRALDVLARHNRTVQVWEDALASDNPFSPSIPRGAVVQQWIGGKMMPDFLGKVRARGGRAVMSGGWYLDALAPTWANMYYVHDNGVFGAQHRGDVLGGEAASWSEHQNEANMDDRIFSRLPAVAERLWTMATQRRYQAIPRYAAILCRLRALGVRVGPADAMPAHCFA